MSGFTGNLRADLKRAFLSPAFFIAVAAMAVLLFLSILYELRFTPRANLSVYYLNIISGMTFSSFSYVLCAIPIASAYCSDWNSRFFRPYCMRSGPRPYCVSKLIAAAFSGGASIALGYTLFFLLLSLWLPVWRTQDIGNMHGDMAGAFGVLLPDKTALFLVCVVLMRFASAALFSVIAFLVSTWFPNQLVTLFSPLLAYYFLINFAHALSLPKWLSVFSVYGGQFNAGGVLFSVIYVFAFTALLSALLGAVSLKNIEARLQHE